MKVGWPAHAWGAQFVQAGPNGGMPQWGNTLPLPSHLTPARARARASSWRGRAPAAHIDHHHGGVAGGQALVAKGVDAAAWDEGGGGGDDRSKLQSLLGRDA